MVNLAADLGQAINQLGIGSGAGALLCPQVGGDAAIAVDYLGQHFAHQLARFPCCRMRGVNEGQLLAQRIQLHTDAFDQRDRWRGQGRTLVFQPQLGPRDQLAGILRPRQHCPVRHTHPGPLAKDHGGGDHRQEGDHHPDKADPVQHDPGHGCCHHNGEQRGGDQLDPLHGGAAPQAPRTFPDRLAPHHPPPAIALESQRLAGRAHDVVGLAGQVLRHRGSAGLVHRQPWRLAPALRRGRCSLSTSPPRRSAR